jgi:hypothetical protein
LIEISHIKQVKMRFSSGHGGWMGGEWRCQEIRACVRKGKGGGGREGEGGREGGREGGEKREAAEAVQKTAGTERAKGG